jgi:nickel-dependent lactate racemase
MMRYGKGLVDIEVPENSVLAIADLKNVSGVQDERAEVMRALNNPIGHRGISILAEKARKTVIVVDDNTRPTPVDRILPILLDTLNEAGIEDRDIRVLIALGTHRPMNDSEMRERVGKEASERVSVTNHHWKQKEMLVDLGSTSSGVPLSVNKTFLEANVRIGVGHIAPHCQAGWTGGAKIVQPGVCGAETTDHTHWLSASFDVRDLIGVADNPVRLEIENVVRKIGLDFILNLVLNEKKEVVKAVAGDFVKAHREGVKEAKAVYFVDFPAKADIVVADAYPLSYGLDFWQASKAILSSYLGVKKGGTIILLAPCPEGVSTEHPELLKLRPKPYETLRNLVETGAIEDLNAASTAAQIGQVLRDEVKVVLYSEGISKLETEKLGFEYTESPQSSVDNAMKRHGSKSKILFLRNGCEILPISQD